jgi:hypothetical protein
VISRACLGFVADDGLEQQTLDEANENGPLRVRNGRLFVILFEQILLPIASWRHAYLLVLGLIPRRTRLQARQGECATQRADQYTTEVIW